ncbi:hypothetical protein K2X05_00840, partial [bacterium]|nr:hypothetical protein [bacterium]
MLLAFLMTLTQILHAETFNILRLEPQHNLAVIATIQAQKFAVGNEFAVETPQGACYLVVKKIVTDYIYVNTEQCQTEYLSKGTPISPRQNIVVEKPTQSAPTILNASLSTDSVSTDLNFLNNEFVQTYLKDRLSVTFSYLAGNTLDGRAQLNANTAIEDFRGSNTVSFGAEYLYWHLPYNLSLSAGMAYSLPRSYGRFQLINNGNAQTVSFGEAPKVETLSTFTNLRYQWNEKTWTYLGLNYLFVGSSGFNG